jgi:hypothetical protein
MEGGEVLMKGYLDKLSSGTVKRYQSRYFEISGHYMTYYATSGSKQTLKGSIDLSMLKTVGVADKDILMLMKDSRRATLRARSNENAEQWKEEITSVIQRVKAEKIKKAEKLKTFLTPTAPQQQAPHPSSTSPPGSVEADQSPTQRIMARQEALSSVRKEAHAKVKTMLAAEKRRREALINKQDLAIITSPQGEEKAEILVAQKLRAVAQGMSAAVEFKEEDEVDLSVEEADEDEDEGPPDGILQLVGRVLSSVRCIDRLSLPGCGLGPNELKVAAPMLTALLSPEAADNNRPLNALKAVNAAGTNVAAKEGAVGPGEGGNRLLARSLHSIDLSFNNIGGWNGEYGDKVGIHSCTHTCTCK